MTLRSALVSSFFGILALALTGCGNSVTPPDMNTVLERAAFAMEEFEGYLQQNGATEASPEDMVQLATYMTDTMNADPRFYDAPIGVSLEQDGSFAGWRDGNGDGVRDAGDAPIFKIEVDSANSRLLATDVDGYGAQHSLAGAGTGFLAGMLLGNLMNRQQTAGIRPGSFDNRQVQSRSAATSQARSRARSGGPSRGK